MKLTSFCSHAPVAALLPARVVQKGQKFFTYHDATSRTVNVSEFLTRVEFDSLFEGKGTLVQPTPENKPKSKVIIRNMAGSALMVLLGSPVIKGQEWTKGGKPTRGFGGFFFGRGGGGGFAKGRKLKMNPLVAQDQAVVTYSTASTKLSVKIQFINKSVLDWAEEQDDY